MADGVFEHASRASAGGREQRGDPAGVSAAGPVGIGAGALAVDAVVPGAGWVDGRRHGVRGLAGEVAALPRRLFDERALIAAGLTRELRARFGTTALGWLWPVLRPLALVAAYAVLFTQLLGLKAGLGGAAPEGSFGVYLVTGVLVWASVSEALSRAALSITDHGGLVKRLAFPPEVLPLQAVLSELLFLLLGALAFLACSGALSALGLPGGWPFPGAALLWLPAVVAVQVVLVYSLALVVAALQVVLRDTQHVLGVLLTLLMFATPVFWVPSAEALPAVEPWLPWIAANPFTHLLHAWRVVLMGAAPAELLGASVTGSMAGSLGYALACGTGLLVLGAALFRHLRPDFADEV